MNTKTKIQKLPKWFDGSHYSDGETVTNPFSGEEIYLNRTELSMYDFLIGAQMLFDMGMPDKSILNDFHKGLDWFKKNNARAYMVLLD
jgi:hypothetical protein